jgi:FSR family fosmidomycin resistance protein-like MFS transporter
MNKKSLSIPVLLLFVCLGHFCVDFMLGIWPVFKTLAQLDLAKAGLVVAACTFVAEIFQCPFGALSDRGYQKVLLIMGICLTTLCSFFSYVSSYTLFLLLILGSYIGSAAFHPTAAGILGSLQSRYKSTIMGIFSAAGMLGLGVSQLLFSHTYQLFDGNTGILALPSFVLAAICLLFFVVPKTPVDKAKHSSFPFNLFFQFLKNPSLRVLYIVMIGNQIALWSTVFLLPDLLLVREYNPWIVYGGAHLMLMTGSAVCPPLLGMIADKSSIKRVLTVLLWATCALFYSNIFISGISPGALFVLLFFLGGVSNSISPLVWAYGGELLPTHRGLISAFLMGFVWIVSETVGIGMSGVLASLFEENAPAKALGCMGTLLFVSAVAIFALPSKKEIVILPSGDPAL